MAFTGALLRVATTGLRAVQFLGAALILAIYSYFLAVLTNRHLHISQTLKAVEGIAGAAVIYTTFAVILTCFLGGITFFAFLALILDILFCGAFIAVAVLTKDGGRSCKGNVNTPLGSGNAATGASSGAGHFGFTSGNTANYAPNLGRDCKLETAVFAVAIVLAIMFLVSAAMQILLSRNQKKEERFGPGPSNNYSTGRQPFWKRKRNAKRDAELGAVGGAGAFEAEKHHASNKSNHNATRPSQETGMTGTTINGPTDASYGGPTTKYGDAPATQGTRNYYGDALGVGALAPGTYGNERYHPNSNNHSLTGSRNQYANEPTPTTSMIRHHHGQEAELGAGAVGSTGAYEADGLPTTNGNLNSFAGTGRGYDTNTASTVSELPTTLPSDQGYGEHELPTHDSRGDVQIHNGGFPHVEAA